LPNTNGLRRIFDPLAMLAGLALSAFVLGSSEGLLEGDLKRGF